MYMHHEEIGNIIVSCLIKKEKKRRRGKREREREMRCKYEANRHSVTTVVTCITIYNLRTPTGSLSVVH
jgi:hypothetical protein